MVLHLLTVHVCLNQDQVAEFNFNIYKMCSTCIGRGHGVVQVVGLEICLRGIGSLSMVCTWIKWRVRAGSIYPFDYQLLAPIYFHFLQRYDV